jgi:hypothetical protein
MVDPMPALARALWGFLLGVLLVLLGAYAASAFQPQDIDTQNGNYFFRDTCGWHGYDCAHLPPSRDGTVTWCKNCLDGSSPAACGGSGCVVDHENGQWRCVGSGGGGGGCLPCAMDSDCDDGNPCTTDTCNAGTCVNILTIAPCADGSVAVGIDGNACAMLCVTCACGGTTTTLTTTTTTSTTTTSTTTTTTTSTTTTTTQPPGPSGTFIWAPTIPLTTAAEAGFGSTNEMKCDAWVPDTGIANATQITFGYLNTNPGVHCGVAIYNFDGSTRIFSTGGVDCSVASPVTVTGSAFALSAGTKYLLCRCSDTTTLPTFVVTGAAGNTGTALSQLANVLGPAGAFIATNPCVAASPPATTGGTNSSDNHIGAVQLLIATTTP